MCTWTSLLWDMGTPMTHVVRYWCPVLVRMRVKLGWVVWVFCLGIGPSEKRKIREDGLGSSAANAPSSAFALQVGRSG